MEVLTVVSILVVLAALLFPAITRMRAQTANTRCIANLRQISTASALYSADNNGYWPPNHVSSPSAIFALYLIPYLGEPPRRPSSRFWKSPLVCPSDVGGPDGRYQHEGVYTLSDYGVSYGQHSVVSGKPRATIENPSEIMAYMDFKNHYVVNRFVLSGGGRVELLEQRHGGAINAAFADGSIRRYDLETIMDPNPDPPIFFW